MCIRDSHWGCCVPGCAGPWGRLALQRPGRPLRPVCRFPAATGGAGLLAGRRACCPEQLAV
eukprot:10368936-Lingulodinium_polyedra.AAC.1